MKYEEVVHKEQVTHLLLTILQIAGHEVQCSSNFEEAYRKRLKFQKTTDWKRYRACVDLLDDTEYAIVSAFEYQLGDVTNNNKDVGERYIRLYGILNAVYLQMNAYKELSKLLNFADPEKLMLNFERLSIYRLRNMAGAHTTDYRFDKVDIENYPDAKKSNSFRIVQSDLSPTGDKIVVLDENDNLLEFNLLQTLTEYESLVRRLLVQLINHTINTLVHKREDKIEMRSWLDELLPKLIDYATINRNQEHLEKLKNK